MLSSVFKILILILFWNYPAYSKSLEVTQDEIYQASEYFDYYEDNTDKLTVQEISEIEDKFIPNHIRSFSLGFRKNPIWIKLKLINRLSKSDFIFANEFAPTDMITLCEEENSEWKCRSQGDLIPFSQREIPHRHYLFKIHLEKNETKTFYIKVKTTSAVIFSYAFASEEKYLANSADSLFLYGIYTGIVILLIIYNLFLYFSFRDVNFLIYIAYIVSYILFSLGATGVLNHYLWKDFTLLADKVANISILTGFLSLSIFSYHFLSLNKTKWIQIFFRIINLILIVGIIAVWINNSNIKYFNMLIVPILIPSIYFGFKRYKEGFTPAKYYILAWITLIIIAMISVFNRFGFLSSKYFQTDILQAGAILETLFLSFALSERIRILNLEKKKIFELEKATEAAEKASRAKSHFLATMSHELRTPLNGVSGMANIVLKTNLTEEQREYIKIIQSSSNLLLNLINDILDYSKIEVGKLKLETVDFNLHETVKEILNIIKSVSKKNLEIKSQIHSEIPALVKGDMIRLEQVLLNLLNNAVKFTEEGSVLLECLLIKKESEYSIIEFSVTDTGIGISEENQKKLFQPFTQADASTTRKYGGTGLGLAISSELVTLMGGELKLESEERKGSKFYFTIKLDHSEEGLIPKSISLDVDDSFALQNPLKILVAEDSVINQMVNRKIFSTLGYNIFMAENGIQAIEILENNSIDMIFMDMLMPVMDGITATQNIRSNPSYKNIPIIALTANAIIEEKDKCLKAGMNDFISKPYKVKDIQAAIIKWKSKINTEQ